MSDRSPFDFDGIHEELVDLNNGVDNSWFPRNLSTAINGGGEPPPSLLEYKPGRSLFYANKVNGVYGKPESGKTWLVSYALKQELLRGGSIWFIDFEDNEHTFVNRLRSLGVPDSVIVSERCQYSNPDQPSLTSLDQIQLMVYSTHFDIIVVDSLNEAMWNDSMNPENNTDCGIFTNRLFKMLLATGACVICIDHEPKNSNGGATYQFGGQQKKAKIRGSLIHLQTVSPFRRGASGESTLEISKDTPGFVRAETLDGKSLGTFGLTSDLLTGNCTVRLDAPQTPQDKIRADLISFVKKNPDCSSGQIRDGVSGKHGTKDKLLKELLEEGSISSRKAGTTVLHRIVENPHSIPSAP